MTLATFNALSNAEMFDAIFACCGCSSWAIMLIGNRPFDSVDELKTLSDDIWNNETQESDWLEAFTHHPKIGDVASLTKKFASTAAWASGEQSGVNTASNLTIEALAKGNTDYEQKFGFIFIVCATGKSAEEILQLLENRLPNDKNTELQIAKNEQNKITHLRIDKLFA